MIAEFPAEKVESGLGANFVYITKLSERFCC